MQRTIAQPLKLALLTSTVAALSLACELGLDKLDAGQDDDSADELTDPNDPETALECTIGTEFNATGTTQTSWTPQCTGGIVCDEGWGHDGDPLPIEWTTQMPVFPPNATHHQPRAVGLFENGTVVVAIEREAAIGFEHFGPDGVNNGGYSVDELGTIIHSVEIFSERAYVTHGEGDGTINLTAIDITSQQKLWTTSFSAHGATAPTRNGGRIALGLALDDQWATNELVVLDIDGNVLLQDPIAEHANVVALSPSGERVAAVGESTRIYSTTDGALLDEFVHGALLLVWPRSSIFIDDERVVSIGSGIQQERFSGWLSGDSLGGDLGWEQVYNRATSWCPDEEDDEDLSTAETAEMLSDVTQLSDGSLVVVGTENYESNGVYGSHPWVARFTSEGEFLGNDRGLWDGHAIDSVAGPDGSVFVLIAEGVAMACQVPCEVSEAFAVRKYVPAG